MVIRERNINGVPCKDYTLYFNTKSYPDPNIVLSFVDLLLLLEIFTFALYYYIIMLLLLLLLLLYFRWTTSRCCIVHEMLMQVPIGLTFASSQKSILYWWVLETSEEFGDSFYIWQALYYCNADVNKTRATKITLRSTAVSKRCHGDSCLSHRKMRIL